MTRNLAVSSLMPAGLVVESMTESEAGIVVLARSEGAGESLSGVREDLKTDPQPLYKDRFRPAFCRSQG